MTTEPEAPQSAGNLPDEVRGAADALFHEAWGWINDLVRPAETDRLYMVAHNSLANGIGALVNTKEFYPPPPSHLPDATIADLRFMALGQAIGQMLAAEWTGPDMAVERATKLVALAVDVAAAMGPGVAHVREAMAREPEGTA